MDSEFKSTLKFVACLVVAAVTLIVGVSMIYPYYNVYSQRMAGEAQLAHAEYSKRIAVESAKAKRDSAVMEAEAEITRAEGAAKANKIIGSSLKDNPEYLKYLWLVGIDHESDKTIIYIPTESNLPILEAGRVSGLKRDKEF